MDDMQTRLAHIETKLDKVVTKESPFQKYILQLITLVFIAGGGWVTLDSLGDTVATNETKIEEQDIRDREIDRRIDRIDQNQEHMKEGQDELKQDVKDIDNKIDLILDELRKQ
jgi:hypothetical protein